MELKIGNKKNSDRLPSARRWAMRASLDERTGPSISFTSSFWTRECTD